MRPARLTPLLAALAWLAWGSLVSADKAIPNGRFFETGPDDLGYFVADWDGYPFWTAFQVAGGEAALGRPVSRRFLTGDGLAQAFGQGLIFSRGDGQTWEVRPPAPVPESARQPEPEPRVSLPADEAPHRDPVEWWYFTGHLMAPDGREFGFELTFFQVVNRAGIAGHFAHFAVSAPELRLFVSDERFGLPARDPQPGTVDLQLEDWQIRGQGRRYRLAAGNEAAGFDLELTDAKQAVLHGDTGLVSYGPAGDSYYYSRTRLTGVGRLRLGGQELPVTVLAWHDRQWGAFTTLLGGGWDWFSIQLDDNTEMMLYLVRFSPGPPAVVHGTYVDEYGVVRSLGSQDFRVTALGTWRSPLTGAVYPSGWLVQLLGQDLELTLTPVMPNQEFISRVFGIAYWEGKVAVFGRRGARDVSGRGYVELTGYAMIR
ncbi:MAG: carotenoid 1,2-hydratase [Chloroflexota bacterium]